MLIKPLEVSFMLKRIIAKFGIGSVKVMINKFVNYSVQSNSIVIFLLSIYFFLSPIEDILNFGFGTMIKYIALVIIFFILVFSLYNSYTWKFSMVDYSLIVLVFLFWFSSLYSKYISITVSRNISYTLLSLFFIVVSKWKYDQKSLEFLKVIIALSGLMTSFYVLYLNDFVFYNRLTLSILNDPNNLAAFLFMPIIITIHLIFNIKKPLLKLFFSLGLIIQLLSFFMTGSRGGFIGLIIAVIIYMYSTFIKHFKTKNVLLIITMVIAIFILVKNLLPDYIYQRIFAFTSYTSDLQSNTSRSAIWMYSINNIIPYMPVMGYGSGITPLVLAEFFNTEKGMHNTYLNLLVELGFIGLIVFMYFLFKIYQTCRKSHSYLILSILFGMLIIIFFLDSYPKKFLWNTLLFGYIYAFNILEKKGRKT
jgi:O-antigen ligase